MDPFCSTVRNGKKTLSILDPTERTVESSGGGGGHSSDSTDGAKERMMIEWGKARQGEGEGGQRRRTRHSKRETERGRKEGDE